MKAKTFDCVEMMHKGAEQIGAKIEGMTRDEELEFWRQATRRLRGARKKAAERKRK